MAGTGGDIVRLARRHVGERCVCAASAPKNNPRWQGPWNCAEFASWLVFQVRGRLYGCDDNEGNPGIAAACTRHWLRDARVEGTAISVAEAARTPGAAVLRHSAAHGHVAVSDGRGGTIEAHSTRTGVIACTLSGRRWDVGVLVPGINYTTNGPVEVPEPPSVCRLCEPRMEGDVVRAIQRVLEQVGFNPGPVDGAYGPMTAAAVTSFQAARGLLVDGEVGAKTARSLGVKQRSPQERPRPEAARPRKRELTGLESLTPSELRVAKLAASGMTNREIAQSLFVTVKAVQWHLRHIYRKLELEGREHLRGALGDETKD